MSESQTSKTQGNILAIDAGNTRIKWGVHDGERWLQRSTLETARALELAAAFAGLPPLASVIASNVAGAALQGQLASTLPPAMQPRWIRSERAQCGVRNSYDDPLQLGCDRWAALIGAWRLHGGPAVVVNAGTALTVDALAGAIERMARFLEETGQAAPLCVLSGGDAALIEPHLNLEVKVVDNLVLEGLLTIARDGIARGACA
jgi:type III pantothenate kinase